MTDFEELKFIAQFLCAKYNITLEELKGRRNIRFYTDIRKKLVYLSKPISHDFEDIGIFINRDRSTIYHYFIDIIERRKIDDKLKSELNDLRMEYELYKNIN